MTEHRGPVTLREKPADRLVDQDAYAIPENPTRDDHAGAAAWVRFLGGQVPFLNEDGFLVVSVYPDDARYYEWVSGSVLLVHNSQQSEFTAYGYSTSEHYIVEPFAPIEGGENRG